MARDLLIAASTSERSENFYQTTRCNTPGDSHIHARRLENKSHVRFSLSIMRKKATSEYKLCSKII
jgi:hypothetical protein